MAVTFLQQNALTFDKHYAVLGFVFYVYGVWL